LLMLALIGSIFSLRAMEKHETDMRTYISMTCFVNELVNFAIKQSAERAEFIMPDLLPNILDVPLLERDAISFPCRLSPLVEVASLKRDLVDCLSRSLSPEKLAGSEFVQTKDVYRPRPYSVVPCGSEKRPFVVKPLSPTGVSPKVYCYACRKYIPAGKWGSHSRKHGVRRKNKDKRSSGPSYS